jgi:hypothetical protein
MKNREKTLPAFLPPQGSPFARFPSQFTMPSLRRRTVHNSRPCLMRYPVLARLQSSGTPLTVILQAG